MVGSLTPFAIVCGGAIAAALIFSSLWQRIAVRVSSFGGQFARELDLGDIGMKPADLGYIVAAIAAALWICLIFLVRPTPIVGIVFLPGCVGVAAYGARSYLQIRVRRRLAAFRGQLEGVMRSLASGVRVGLGLRQGLVYVAENVADPARKELLRVIGVSNMGGSVLDALDELGCRFATPETQMMGRVIRVQADSGGDLAGVLEGLADTIRDRRRLERRVKALTAQSRATGWLLGLLPLAMCAFLLTTQPAMRDAALFTAIGRSALLLGFGLDMAAVYVLSRLTRLDA